MQLQKIVLLALHAQGTAKVGMFDHMQRTEEADHSQSDSAGSESDELLDDQSVSISDIQAHADKKGRLSGSGRLGGSMLALIQGGALPLDGVPTHGDRGMGMGAMSASVRGPRSTHPDRRVVVLREYHGQMAGPHAMDPDTGE